MGIHNKSVSDAKDTKEESVDKNVASYKCKNCNSTFDRKFSRDRHETGCMVLRKNTINAFEEDNDEHIESPDNRSSNTSKEAKNDVKKDPIICPIYNIKRDHVSMKDIKNITQDDDMILKLAKVFYGNADIKENHVIYAEDGRCYMYDGSKWNRRRVSQKSLIEFMNYVFHATESIILKVDVMGESDIYNNLVKKRDPNVLKTYAKDHRSELENLLTSFKFAKKTHQNWLESSKVSSKSNLPKIDPIDHIISHVYEAPKFKLITLDVSPYNSDDDSYYQESMKMYKEQNKILQPDGTVTDVPKKYNPDETDEEDD